MMPAINSIFSCKLETRTMDALNSYPTDSRLGNNVFEFLPYHVENMFILFSVEFKILKQFFTDFKKKRLFVWVAMYFFMYICKIV